MKWQPHGSSKILHLEIDLDESARRSVCMNGPNVCKFIGHDSCLFLGFSAGFVLNKRLGFKHSSCSVLGSASQRRRSRFITSSSPTGLILRATNAPRADVDGSIRYAHLIVPKPLIPVKIVPSNPRYSRILCSSI